MHEFRYTSVDEKTLIFNILKSFENNRKMFFIIKVHLKASLSRFVPSSHKPPSDGPCMILNACTVVKIISFSSFLHIQIW